MLCSVIHTCDFLILFVRPGTGKTITIVEAIRQVLRRYPRARILACAPSNSAADLIALRLRVLGEGQLFRFYAASRPKSSVPPSLLPFTRLNSNNDFTAPSLPELRRLRVVVTTCVSAAFAYGVGVPRGHFTHIFVDEAGQASEPEVMIAVKTMADRATNVVLAGDPKQLRPIVRSPISRRFGLEKSYLERLMEREVYDDFKGSPAA